MYGIEDEAVRRRLAAGSSSLSEMLQDQDGGFEGKGKGKAISEEEIVKKEDGKGTRGVDEMEEEL